jgi:hypothetical protein
MREIIVEDASAGARASAPNAINAAYKKSKAALQPFNTTGFNLLEQAEEPEDENGESTVRDTPIKTLFGDILAEARAGQDVVSRDMGKEDGEKEVEYERLDARAATPKSGMPADMLGPPERRRAQKASQHDDQYRPKHPLIERRPLGVKDSSRFGTPLPINKRKRREIYSSVPLCKHLELFLDWDSDDSDNHKGSWILNIDKYEDVSPWSEHHSCAGVDVKKMADAMYDRMGKKFTRLEDEQLSKRDIDSGKARRRPPQKQRVVRELYNMYSQILRTQDYKLVDEKEALRVKLDASERRKELAEKTLEQAQKSIQRGSMAQSLNDNTQEGDQNPASSSDSTLLKKKKTPKQIAEEKVARSRKRRGLSDIARIRAEPANRFKSTTSDEQDARVSRVAKQVRRERVVEKKPSAAKPTRRAKKTTLPPAPLLSDSENEHSEEEVVAKRKVTKKSTSQRMSKAERVLLKGITQAEQEESEQYAQAEAGAAQQVGRDSTPPLSKEEKEAAFQAEIEAIERAQLAAQKRKAAGVEENTSPHINKKRKATPLLDDEEIPPQKKSHNQRKSATTVEDSDEEAEFATPEANSALPHLEVGGEVAEIANTKSDGDILDENVEMTNEENGGSSVGDRTEEGNDRLDDLFEE